MGTVPVPIVPGAGTAATSAQAASWANAIAFALKPPMARVITNALVSITAGVPLLVPFAAETIDNVQSGDTEMHSTSTNPSRVTIRTAGVYEVHGQVQVSTTGSMSANLMKTGVAVSSGIAHASVSGQSVFEIQDFITCAVGDYIELQVNTTAAGSITAAWPTWMTVRWISN